MPSNGWGKLGAMLAGNGPAEESKIYLDTQRQLASRDTAVSGARIAMDKADQRVKLGDHYRALGFDEKTADAMAGIQRGGFNPNQAAQAVGQIDENRYRQAAADAALDHDFGAANANLMGVAPGPVALPQVVGGVKLSNRLLPGGGEMELTPVGDSQINLNSARATKALTPPLGRSTVRGAGTAAPKLSAVDTARMKSELKGVELEEKAIEQSLADNTGATTPKGQAALAAAKTAMADIQKRKSAIFDRFDQKLGGGGGLGASLTGDVSVDSDMPFVIDEPESFSPQQAAAVTAKTGGVAPAGVSKNARREGYQDFDSGIPAAAKAKLKEGEKTTFGNGQVWSLVHGQPTRIH